MLIYSEKLKDQVVIPSCPRIQNNVNLILNEILRRAQSAENLNLMYQKLDIIVKTIVQSKGHDKRKFCNL